MNAKNLFKTFLILLAAFFISFPVHAEASNKKVILVDPGHGGKDPGAVTKSGTIEKEVNLNISLKLKSALEKRDFKVEMTRDKDLALSGEGRKFIKREDLVNRCKLKDGECDLFISIHQNMFEQSKYSGAQVWYSKNAESKILAKLIQDNIRNNIDKENDRVEKPANDSYKILRCNDDLPSVIVECGFLSNPSEEQKLKDEAYQNKMAECIADSIKTYFETAKR